jgi:hypothetical protein
MIVELDFKNVRDGFDKDKWYFCFNGGFQRFFMVGKIEEDLFDDYMCQSGEDHMHCITHIAELPEEICGIKVQVGINGG